LDKRTKADQLLELTQAMLMAAKLDAWDEFELLDQQRSVIMEMVFSSSSDDESVKVYLAEVVSEIQLIDQDITLLIVQQRDQAAEELLHLRRAREGSNAYRIAVDDLGE
jgi:hypothetical protein